MAGYIENTLGSGEHIVYRARVAWMSQIINLCLGLGLLAVGIGVLFLAAAVLNVLTTELALTNRRVVAKFGFIRRETVELNLDKVESVVVEQGVLGRLFGFGSVGVRGIGGSNAPVPYIADPLEFRRQVHLLLDAKHQAGN